jgi:DNA-directed RNA polymerase subunit E'/Rpb7
MGDPLFERRELVRNVHIDSRFLQRNIQASLLAQLRMKYEGMCVAEGYIQRRSITVVDHSLGRMNYIKGGLDYTVKFQADICMPHPGQVFRMPVVLKSKLGLHVEMNPIKALLPRDLHIGMTDFEDVSEKEEIEFEVVGARFQQGDESIVVLGKLRGIIQPAAPNEEGVVVDTNEPMMAAPIVRTGEEQVVKKVTVDMSSTKAADQGPRKRRVRLNPEANAKANEAPAEGKA